jgi:hypothetical protein
MEGETMTECYLIYRYLNADPNMIPCLKINPKTISQKKNYIEKVLKSKGHVTFDNTKEDIKRFKNIQKQIPEREFYRQNPVKTGHRQPKEELKTEPLFPCIRSEKDIEEIRKVVFEATRQDRTIETSNDFNKIPDKIKHYCFAVGVEEVLNWISDPKNLYFEWLWNHKVTTRPIPETEDEEIAKELGYVKRKRGRPKGSKNKPKNEIKAEPQIEIAPETEEYITEKHGKATITYRKPKA